ncbi:MAG TPA: DUF423 domain-containing protein [Chitinophagaceae bacterium]|nr:DUF423 domain-containing protein [Chitinophagaceae bacterium]
MHKTALIAGIIFAGLGVVIGAFAAHGLKPMMELSQQQTFETGVRYQMYHSFALIAVGLLSAHFSNNHINLATLFFILGIVCFSGSLYALSLMQMNGIVGLKGIGIITPIGGVFFILGWLFSLLAVLKNG